MPSDGPSRFECAPFDRLRHPSMTGAPRENRTPTERFGGSRAATTPAGQCVWWMPPGSNRRPRAYRARALPTELDIRALAEGERFERSRHVAAAHRFPAGTDGPLLHPSLLWASPRVTASSHPGATRHLLALCLPCAAGSIRLDRLQWSLAFWRKMEHSKPTPGGALCFQGSAGTSVRFIFHDLVGVAGFEPAAACSQSRPSGR